MSDNHWTITQIAKAAGISRQAVREELASTVPSSQVIVSGAAAKAFEIGKLPARLQGLLVKEARRQGHKSIDALLGEPVERWAPPLPLPDIKQHHVDKAAKLQRALRRTLEFRSQPGLSAAELERIGLEDYEREFGVAITARHLRGLVKRILDRSAGVVDLGRLELFLEERLARRRVERPAISLALQTEFGELRNQIGNFNNPAQPSIAEKCRLWQVTLELFAGRCAEGAAPAKLRRRLIAFLLASMPSIATSESALKVSFRRRWAAFLKGHTITDARLRGESGPEQRKAQPYSPDQVDLVRYYAATRTGARRAQSVRELDEMGLVTDPRLRRSIDTRASKSDLPRSFRKELSDLPALRVMAIGPRATRKMSVPLKLTFAGMHSMGMITGDDKTLDLYVPVPDGNGWFEMLRPQLLVFVDVKSMFVVGRAILPRSQYTAIDTWAGFKSVIMKWGLPKFIQREGGLWRKAKLVNSLAAVGNPDAPFSSPEIEFRLSRKGVQFVTDDSTTLARLESVGIQFREAFAARAKIVERVIGIFSDGCEKLPGYCGRAEKIDCPELTKKNVGLVRGRKAHPGELGFLMWPQLISAIDMLLGGYNKARQEGRRLAHPETGEPMSPEEAFELYRNVDDPPIGFDAECAVLLSHNPVPGVVVRAPDLRRRTFPCGYARVKGNIYCNEETGRRIGQKLIAYFDPLMPEICAFTDELGQNPFIVPRLPDANGWIMDEQTKTALAQAREPIAALKADYRAMQAKFEPLLRRNVVSADTVALSAEVKAGQERLQKARASENARRTRVRALLDSDRFSAAGLLDTASPEQLTAAERLTTLLNEKNDCGSEGLLDSAATEGTPGIPGSELQEDAPS